MIAVYAAIAHPAWSDLGVGPADEAYNGLVEGFRRGQLAMDVAVPPGLAALPDPYDPVANRVYRLPPWRLHDLSYYRGRLYLYFGPTPALILFWPYAALTGAHLSEVKAVLVFSSLGFLAAAGLLRAYIRRVGAPEGFAVVGALALGLGTGVPELLQRVTVYEVAITGAYALVMAALVLLWRALLSEGRRRGLWLGLASVCYGLALGARPSVLLGAAALLVPVAAGWDDGGQGAGGGGGPGRWSRRAGLLAAAVGPVAVAGVALLLYNARRFGQPLEFGPRFQLAGADETHVAFFGLGNVAYNLRLYFLEPAQWGTTFPFLRRGGVPPVPVGHAPWESSFGILPNLPLAWAAAAAPWVLFAGGSKAHRQNRGLAAALCLLVGASVATIGLYWFTSERYEVEFLPELLLLSCLSVAGLGGRLAARRKLRTGLAWVFGAGAAATVAFNGLAAVVNRAQETATYGAHLLQSGRAPEACAALEQALALDPAQPEAHVNRGIILSHEPGRLPEAIAEYQYAIGLRPAYPEAETNLGNALLRTPGREGEAPAHYAAALRANPDFLPARRMLERLRRKFP